MKNKLIDVHNILMATLEDLDDEELLENPDRLKRVVELAKAKSAVANTLVNVDSLGLAAMRQQETNGIEIAETLRITER